MSELLYKQANEAISILAVTSDSRRPEITLTCTQDLKRQTAWEGPRGDLLCNMWIPHQFHLQQSNTL